MARQDAHLLLRLWGGDPTQQDRVWTGPLQPVLDWAKDYLRDSEVHYQQPHATLIETVAVQTLEEAIARNGDPAVPWRDVDPIVELDRGALDGSLRRTAARASRDTGVGALPGLPQYHPRRKFLSWWRYRVGYGPRIAPQSPGSAPPDGSRAGAKSPQSLSAMHHLPMQSAAPPRFGAVRPGNEASGDPAEPAPAPRAGGPASRRESPLTAGARSKLPRALLGGTGFGRRLYPRVRPHRLVE